MNKLFSLAAKKAHDVDPPCFSSLISLVYCEHPRLCPCISCFIISCPTDPFARNSLFFPLSQEYPSWILCVRHISNITLSRQRMSAFILESRWAFLAFSSGETVYNTALDRTHSDSKPDRCRPRSGTYFLNELSEVL